MSDLQNINCQEALEINRKETNASFIKFFDTLELLLDKIFLETMVYSWYLKIYESQR